jgi:hypothetical protein
MVQGAIQKPENKIEFFKHESITTPFFNSVMSEERYHLLLKFIHFVNNETFDENSETRRLFKIQIIL